MRIYNASPFLLAEHIIRLENSARFLTIKSPIPFSEMPDRIAELIRLNNIQEGSLRLTLTRGTALPLQPLPKCGHLYIYVDHYSPITEPACAITASWQRHSSDPLWQHKTTSYLQNRRLLQLAIAQGANEGLFVNEKEEYTEGTASNFFIIENGILTTPPTEAGLLPGITRQLVLQLAAEIDIPWQEKPITKQSIGCLQGAFLTNSRWEIRPLHKIDGHLLPHHPWVSILQNAYHTRVKT